MSNTINNGGPAFPVPFSLDESGGGPVFAELYGNGGMTLRDYFAAKVMQGMYNDGSVVAASKLVDDSANMDAVARWSYAQADAMLRARKETK